jgi:hypothetical protein
LLVRALADSMAAQVWEMPDGIDCDEIQNS